MPLLGILQNDEAPLIIDEPPFFDLLQGSKAAEAGKVIVQATIAYARRLSGAFSITHLSYNALRGVGFNHTRERESEQSITGPFCVTWLHPQKRRVPGAASTSRRHLYNGTPLHHEGHMFDRGDVVERRAWHRHDIRKVARLELANLAAPA